MYYCHAKQKIITASCHQYNEKFGRTWKHFIISASKLFLINLRIICTFKILHYLEIFSITKPKIINNTIEPWLSGDVSIMRFFSIFCSTLPLPRHCCWKCWSISRIFPVTTYIAAAFDDCKNKQLLDKEALNQNFMN